MTAMTAQQLQRLLEQAKNTSPELEDCFLRFQTRRDDEMVSIAQQGDEGAIYPQTQFYSFTEMYAYLQGYIDKSTRP